MEARRADSYHEAILRTLLPNDNSALARHHRTRLPDLHLHREDTRLAGSMQTSSTHYEGFVRRDEDDRLWERDEINRLRAGETSWNNAWLPHMLEQFEDQDEPPHHERLQKIILDHRESSEGTSALPTVYVPQNDREDLDYPSYLDPLYIQRMDRARCNQVKCLLETTSGNALDGTRSRHADRHPYHYNALHQERLNT
jgi:hypothetical protein